MSNSFWSCRHYLLLRFEFDMIRYDQNSTPSQNMKWTLLPLSYNSVVNIDTVSNKNACAKSVCLLIQNTLFIFSIPHVSITCRGTFRLMAIALEPEGPGFHSQFSRHGNITQFNIHIDCFLQNLSDLEVTVTYFYLAFNMEL